MRVVKGHKEDVDPLSDWRLKWYGLQPRVFSGIILGGTGANWPFPKCKVRWDAPKMRKLSGKRENHEKKQGILSEKGLFLDNVLGVAQFRMFAIP